MKSPLARAQNRWQNLREKTVFQLGLLERENVISNAVAESLRAAFYEADETLKQTVFALCDQCGDE